MILINVKTITLLLDIVGGKGHVRTTKDELFKKELVSK